MIYYHDDSKLRGEEMETAQLIIQGIQQLGFPIAVAILAFWYIKYREDKNDQRLYDLREAYENEQREIRSMHRDETAKLTEAINNNTLVITKLYERLSDDVK